MAINKDIKLNDLLVNTENYRFDPVSSQKEAINTMLNDQGDSLYNLAEHIIEHGLNPNDKPQVILSNQDQTKYIVLEGNRRTVALKLLNNPDLIDINTFSSLRKKFKNLHDNNKSLVLKEVNCTIYDDPAEADVWIGIKHGYGKTGTGTDSWDTIQKHRFAEKTEGKTSTTIQIIKKLKNSPDVPDDIKGTIEKINTTNLDRLIGDPDVREFLGIEINNGVVQSSIDEREVIKGRGIEGKGGEGRWDGRKKKR